MILIIMDYLWYEQLNYNRGVGGLSPTSGKQGHAMYKDQGDPIELKVHRRNFQSE